ncbi:CHAD domain-containing protein [Paraburkholderia sp. SIMBA_030]|uniref:CHAD domain-containing protein n=1 Tax=Paraburkholderia sp. SIMBA_030 TaxID=3085773 RepID=UPI00397B9FEB
MSSHPLVTATEETADPSAPSDRARAGPIKCETPVADAFLLLAASTAHDAIQRVRKLDSKADPEILHKLRVALRRLRSLWWAYEPLLDKKDAKFQRSEFKSLADAAGKTRNWDVLRDLLAADPSTKHSFAALIQLVDEHRADALSFSRRAIANAGVEQILARALAGARHQLDTRATSPSLTAFAEERVKLAEKALKKRVERAASQNDVAYAVLHEVRIAGKKLRYLLEFFSPVLDGSHQAAIERLSGVQDELGKLNDLVTSETLLREYADQLGEPKHVKEAVRYLQDRKSHRMRKVHEILRTVC